MKLDDPVKENMRDVTFKDSFSYSNKQRFGLFSQPYSIACGDTNYYRKTKPRRGEDGEVLTDPVHFKAGTINKRLNVDENTILVGGAMDRVN